MVLVSPPTRPWENSAVELEVGPAGDVDDDAGDGPRPGDLAVGEADDTALVAQRLLEGLAQRDGDVLDGVVFVHHQVTLAGDGEVEQAVRRERIQHVVEEADAGVDRGVAVAVEVQGDLHVGLGGSRATAAVLSVMVRLFRPSYLAIASRRSW